MTGRSHFHFWGRLIMRPTKKLMRMEHLGPTLVVLTLICPQIASQSQPGPATLAGKKAPEVFKNIQVLKDLDADQLQPSMQFIAASLGVECSHCHVKNANEKDDKPAKVKARRMMQLTFELNKTNFDNQRVITCNTCHHGELTPAATPAVLETEGERADPPPSRTSPAPDQLFSQYAQATGGTQAFERITTRVEKGSLIFGDTRVPIEIYAKSPNKRVSISHGDHSETVTAFDGAAGWFSNTGMPIRDMYPVDARSAMVDAIFDLPLDAPKIFPKLRAGSPEKLGDREMWVVFGSGQNVPLTKFYFDEQTGLLMRLERYNDAGLGLMPVRVDYSDYRDADGIRIPFHWTLSRPTGRFSIQIDKVQQNVAIDDARFSKPSSATN